MRDLSWSCKERGFCKGTLCLEFCCLFIFPCPQIKPSSLPSLGTGGRSEIWRFLRLMERGDILLPIFYEHPGEQSAVSLARGD